MTEVFHRNFFLEGKAGRLEAMLWTAPPSMQRLVAVVCHPHPLFGGTMHNKVVYQAAKALHERGIPVLRFNFRGAALSEGEHDRGRGEQDDVRARPSIFWPRNSRDADYCWRDSALAHGLDCGSAARTRGYTT